MVGWSVPLIFAGTVRRLLGGDFSGDICLPGSDYSVPTARSDFARLLAANPNHFGNAPESGFEPIQPLANDVTYEQLNDVGFNAPLQILSATIEVKKDTGFSGNLCTNGSYEYVRFWADYGNGWTNIGYVSVNTHDIANDTDCQKTPNKPLYYTLSIPYVPISQNCSFPVFPHIRAILSWDQIPPDTDPNWQPVWGNSVDQHIQSRLNASIPLLTAQDAVSFAADAPDEPVETCHPSQNVSYADIRAKRRDTHSGDKQIVLGDDDFHQTAGDTSWEEMIGLGMDYGLSALVAVVKVKKRDGFGTDPCRNGTTEYVSFWADLNNTCNYTFLGTRKINVHDFSQLPLDGLTYTAIMPIDTSSAQSFCNKTKIARIRAALSWETPPPEPPALPTYGNYLERHVQLQPYTTPPATQGSINVIGDVGINYIDTSGNGMTLPHAQYSFPHIPTDPAGLNRPSPFGGLIRIQCLACTPPPGVVYRVLARPFNPANPSFPGNPIVNPITVVDATATPPQDPTSLVFPLDGEGYFAYLPPAKNLYGDLAAWRPGVDGLYQIRLETATASLPRTHVAYSPWYTVRVNNEVPVGGLEFQTGTCSEIIVGQPLSGKFFADMPVSPQFLAGWSMGILPPNQIPPPGILPGGGTSAVPPDANGNAVATWKLDTKGGMACGYVVVLNVRSLTVYNSFPSPLQIYIYRGFCLRAG